MAMEDNGEGLVALDIQPPKSAPGAIPPPAAGHDVELLTPEQQIELAKARAAEEGVKEHPVVTTGTASDAGVAPPPPNASATIATIAKRLEDWAQTLADQIAKTLEEKKDLEARLGRQQIDLDNAVAECQAYYELHGPLPEKEN